MIVADMVLMPIAVWCAFSLRLSEFYLPVGSQWWLFIAAPLLAFPVFVRTGLYRAVIRYMGYQTVWAIAKGVSLAVLLWGVVVFLSGIPGTPRSIVIIYWFTSVMAVGASRMAVRWLYARLCFLENDQKAVVIYGAGEAGIQLASALRYGHELFPVAFIDDDPMLRGRVIRGLEVYEPSGLDNLIQSKRVEEVLIAVPSASRSRVQQILGWIEPYPVHVRVLPGVSELAEGRVRVEDLREIQIEDLLGRDPVSPNPGLLSRCIRGKSVMVTGAGGSIGSELCRQIAKLSPRRLVLLERSEAALYQIDKELRANTETSTTSIPRLSRDIPKSLEIVPLLGSVLHQDRIEAACRAFGIQTIYHTAAYKHVPIVEVNPIEGVYNNIFGTYRAALAALSSGVDTFVLISTDKAVRPTNVMGATKRFAEMILQSLSSLPLSSVIEIAGDQTQSAKTRFCMVRFGNVLNSSGSVVPLFREQIQKGGPITLTHENIIRYFMTIPEAAQLVLQASAMAQGGDVFLLDMGKPVRVFDLARRMIRLAGLKVRDDRSPEGDIEIEVTGLRPGEKLYEELLIGSNASPTEHSMIMRAMEKSLSWRQLQHAIFEFEGACQDSNFEHVSDILQKTVKEYAVQSSHRDIVWRFAQAG